METPVCESCGELGESGLDAYRPAAPSSRAREDGRPSMRLCAKCVANGVRFDSEPVPDAYRCEWAVRAAGPACARVASRWWGNGLCVIHQRTWTLRDLDSVSAHDKDLIVEMEANDSRDWARSREYKAFCMLTNQFEMQALEDWCEVFGCCGRGWAASEDDQAYGELASAHLMAGLPLPDWVTNWRDLLPKRRDPDKPPDEGRGPSYRRGSARVVVRPTDELSDAVPRARTEIEAY